MDLTIPGDVGGEETLAALRQIDPNLKAIVSSGYSQNPVMANYRAYGFHGVLPKPYSADQLSASIAQVLDPAT
jgi:DNA-binding NarL/FixJ family response regulator